MNEIIRYLYLVAFGVLFVAQCTNEAGCYTKVATCPCTEKLWKERSQNATCHHPKEYACVLHTDDILVEICTTNFIIPKGFAGCPYVKVCNEKGEAEFGLPSKYEKCPESIEGCPNKKHQDYSIHQMYLYPACFITERTNITNSRYEKYCTIKQTSKRSSGSSGNDNPLILIIVVIVATLIATIIVAAIAVIWCRRRRRRRGIHEEKEQRVPLQNSQDNSNGIHEEKEQRVPLQNSQDNLNGIPEEKEQRVQLQNSQDNSNDFPNLKKKLLEINKSKVNLCRRTYSNLWHLNLPTDTNHFASVSLKEDIDFKNYGIRSDGDKSDGIRINTLEDLFDENKESARYVFIRGEAGSGKTTLFTKLLDYWCKANEDLKLDNALRKFQFVFHIRLRNVDKGKSSVIEMICHDSMFVPFNELHYQIREVISNKKYRCLIILDGLHDWKPTMEVQKSLKDPGIPNFDPMSNNVVLISSRPWKLEKISESISDLDRIVDIKGFDDRGMKKIFESISLNQFKVEQEELDDKFESFRKDYQDSFASNTFLLTAVIILWYENAETGKSKTHFFLSLLQYLFKREKDYNGECFGHSMQKVFENMGKVLKDYKSLRPYKSVLIRLGKLAYDDLVAGTDLDFEENELSEEIGQRNLNFVRDIGLLSTPENISKYSNKNVRVHFVHPNIRELLAALHVVACQLPLNSVLSDVYKVFELYNVITLISGFSLDMSYQISNRITEIARKEIDMYRDTFDYEKHSIIRRLYHLQLDCYQEASESKITGSPTCMVSDVYLRNEDITENGIYVDLTKTLLREPVEHVKSLYLRAIPNHENGGIPDSTLKYFLQKNPQLESINIKSENDKPRRFESATLFNIVKKRALVLDNVILTTDTLIAIQQKVTVAQQLSTFGLWNIKEEPCPSSQGLPSAMMQMIQVLPDIPHLTTLFVSCLYNKEDRQHFIKILPRIEHLRNFQYGGDRTKNDIDNSVVKTILASHAKVLKKLWLNYLVLENDSLNGLDDMACIEKIELREVKMEETGWENIVKAMEKIHRPFENTFVGTDIPEAIRQIVEDSIAFDVTYGKSHIPEAASQVVDESTAFNVKSCIHWGGHQAFCFRRVGPLSS